MKKILFLMYAILTGFLSAYATDEVVVANVTVPQGGTGTVNIELNNKDQEYTAFQMQLLLPEGISFVVNRKGNPTFEKGERYDDHSLSSSALGVFTCASFSLSSIDGTEGLLLGVYVAADANLKVGQKVQAKLTNIELTTMNVQRVQFDDVIIDITIGEAASTNVEAVQDDADTHLDEWYSLDGHKLRGKPTTNGIYVSKKRKVLKK